MKRIIALTIMLLMLAVAANAQDKAKPQPEAKADAVKPFTPQQVEQLKQLNSVFTLAQANIRAAQAEAELAQERIKGVLKDVCHEAGIALDECTVDPEGKGVKRVARPKKPPEKEP